MPQITETQDNHAELEDADHKGHAEMRRTLASSLNDIATEVNAVLRDADLRIPVFFTVPSSGESIMTFATPIDPSDQEWERVAEIILPIVASKIGAARLRSRAMPCVAAGIPFSAADLLPRCDATDA